MTIDYNVAVKATEVWRDKTTHDAGASPALVIVDFQRAFTENKNNTDQVVDAMRSTQTLAARARSAKVPVLYLAIIYDTDLDVPLSWRKEGALFRQCERGSATAVINPMVAMGPNDLLIEKTHASGFYGTDLHERLQQMGIDTLLLAGTSTSGCVRATAVDAAARSYRVLTVEECCVDSRQFSSAAALYDIADRYGDVVHIDQAFDYLGGLPITV